MYSDYSYYLKHGGKLTEDEYNQFVCDAADKINYYSLHRAESAIDTMSDEIKTCECKIVDVLSDLSLIHIGVSSEGNDGVNISYSQTAQKDIEQKIKSICKQYLTSPENLMYAGLMYYGA